MQALLKARHKWFPTAVLALTAAIWVWVLVARQYQNLLHVLGTLFAVGLVALWFLRFGAGKQKRRNRVVGLLTASIALFFVVFRPVYNGDMGVHSWRLRFGTRADRTLQPIHTTGEAIDWKPLPRDYPRFLGSGYWAEVKDVELDHDWKAHPPKELWRREIGAGWSAFAIVGNYAVTQEQRGEDELVTCYRLETGELVWTHADKARFDPSSVQGGLGDIGPRATPTIHGDRIVTQGGTGIVNCLDARTGKPIWSHDTAAEFGVEVLTWGKAGSPLVVDDMVVISIGTPTTGDVAAFDASLVAFDAATGAVRWKAGKRQASYASPVLATFGGEWQIVVVNQGWITSHRPSDGKVLWEYAWPGESDGSATCPQPMPLDGDRLFVCKGYGVGSSLLAIRRDERGEYSISPLWKPALKKAMKCKFSNVVVPGNYIYGLDDVLLECIQIDTGDVQWRKRRVPPYGHGQIMLIGNMILVLSETGEVALVEASPTEYRELASLHALDGANVTWNNPAFASPYLIIRNAREAVCYELPLKQ
jgi:outer membrane protein assembly factor BamB